MEVTFDRLPALSALSQFVFRDQDINPSVWKIEPQAVAITQRANGPAVGCLGRDVSDASAGSAGAE